MRPASVPHDLPNVDASRIVRAHGIDFHVQVAGSTTNGPVVLLLHGAAASTHTWRHILPPLADGMTVIAPDLPGHGFTGAAADALSLPGMTLAVRRLLDALALEPTVVVGHSAGAAVMLRMALDGRLPAARELIGFGASLVPPDLTYRTFVAPFVHPFVTSPPVVHAATAIARIPGVARGILHATGSHVDEVSRHWYERFMRSEPHVRAVLTMMANFELPTLLRDLPSLPLPVTLLHGSQDGFIPCDALTRAAARIPGASLTIVDGVGHLLHEELPGRAVSAIRAAVGRCERSAIRPHQRPS
jgi:magnesium chelatase accessory protein